MLELSQLFEISLDALVKGDIEIMKNQINSTESEQIKKVSIIFASLSVVMLVSIVPLFIYMRIPGLIVWGVIAVITMIYSLYVEKLKASYNIQTYKEIRDFMDGKKLDEIRSERSKMTVAINNISKMLIGGVVGFVVVSLIMMLLN